MRAAWYERTGPAAEVLTVGEMPTPSPGPGEVLVRVAASGVNPSDWKARSGSRPMAFPRVVPHSDGAGVVEAIGEGVPASRVGQRVWLWNAAWGRAGGTAAEYTALPAAQAVPLPEGTSFEEGACLGIPALTALHALLTDGGVAGRSVLVQGGAGAVGHYAVRFARLLGASQVIATVSGDAKAAHARDAGADAVVDRRAEDVAARVADLTSGRGVDRVVEVEASSNAPLLPALLAPGGLAVVYGSDRPEVALPFFPAILRGIGLRFFIVYELAPADRAAATGALTAWLARGLVRHAVGSARPLAEIADAHDAVERGAVLGTTVLIP